MMIVTHNKIILFSVVVLTGLMLGLFIMPMMELPLKMAAVLGFSAAFSLVMLITRFSRNLIYLGLAVALIIYLDFYLIHVEHTGIVHGISLSVLDFLILILLMRRLLFAHEYHPIKIQTTQWKQGVWAALFLIVAFSLSVINSKFETLTFFAIVHYIKLFVFFLVLVFDLTRAEDILALSEYFTLALLIISLYCVLQYVTKTNLTVSFNVHEDPIWYEGPFVPVGPAGSANVTAGQIIGLMPFAWATAFRHHRAVYRFLSVIIILLSIVVLFLSNSRASWGIFLAGSFLMLLLLTWKKKISYKYIIAVLAAGTLAAFVIIPILLQKVDIRELTDLKNIYARFNLLQTSFLMVMDYPVLGVGLNTYTKLMMDYIPSIVLKFEWNYMVHNKYMLVWSETGTFGLTAYLLFLIIQYKLLIQYILKYDDELMWIASAILSAFFSMNAHMLFESYSGGSIIFFFWMLCACTIAMHRIAGMKQNEP